MINRDNVQQKDNGLYTVLLLFMYNVYFYTFFSKQYCLKEKHQLNSDNTNQESLCRRTLLSRIFIMFMAYCHQFPNLDTFNEKGKELLKYCRCFMHSFQ